MKKLFLLLAFLAPMLFATVPQGLDNAKRGLCEEANPCFGKLLSDPVNDGSWKKINHYLYQKMGSYPMIYLFWDSDKKTVHKFRALLRDNGDGSITAMNEYGEIETYGVGTIYKSPTFIDIKVPAKLNYDYPEMPGTAPEIESQKTAFRAPESGEVLPVDPGQINFNQDSGKILSATDDGSLMAMKSLLSTFQGDFNNAIDSALPQSEDSDSFAAGLITEATDAAKSKVKSAVSGAIE